MFLAANSNPRRLLADAPVRCDTKYRRSSFDANAATPALTVRAAPEIIAMSCVTPFVTSSTPSLKFFRPFWSTLNPRATRNSRMTTESAILSFLLAAECRFVVRPDGEGIVHQRDVGEAERPIEQRLVPAHLRVHRREQPVLAAGQRADPA